MKKSVLFLLLAGIVLSSCDKFLDRTPDDKIFEDQVFADYSRANGLISKLYEDMRARCNGVVTMSHFSLSGMTDECEGSTVEGDIVNKYNRGEYGPSIGYPSTDKHKQYWEQFYETIRKTNVFIDGVKKYNTPDNPDRPGDLAIRIGEAYFFRAWYHYIVLRWYGDLVYMDKTTDFKHDDMNYAKISAPDAIDKMIIDLEEAISRLPVNQPTSDFARVEKGTAMALKARLLFIKASPMYNGGAFPSDTRVDHTKYATYDKEKWKAAADAAKAVMDLTMSNGQPRYSLFKKYSATDYYTSSISKTNKSNTNNPVLKRIKEIYHDMEAINNEWIFVLSRHKAESWQGDHIPPTAGGAARLQPVQEQVDEYEFIGSDGRGYPVYHPNAAALGYDDSDPYHNRDPRFYADIMYHGCTFQVKTDPLITDPTTGSADRIGANNATSTGYYLRKFYRDEWVKGSSGWPLHFPQIRLPEMWLIYCEAICRYSGYSNEVVNIINELRARSFMAPVPDGLTQDELLKYIQRERRVELFYENDRYFVTRWMLEPTSPEETARQQAYDALPDADKPNYWPYPRTQKQIHGMKPVQDPSGKMVVNGINYRMERFQKETRIFNIPQMYYLPILQVEITNCPTIIQNPGW